MNATAALKKAVYDALKDAVTGTVHRAVPQGQPFPYTVIGATTEVREAEDMDTDDSDLTVTILPYDKSNSAANINTMMGEIDTALNDQDLDADGRTFFVTREIYETFTEKAADGATLQRGRLVYRAKTYE